MRAIPFTIMLATLALSAAAEARPPNPREAAWFYNRPGVEVSQFEADSSACAQFGAQMVGRGVVQNFGLVGLALAGGNALSFADECMIARGYRRFDIAGEALSAFSERFAAMPQEQRLALVSAEMPSEGVLSRRPGNNLWLAGEDDPPVELRDMAPTITPPPTRLVTAQMLRGRENANIRPGPNDAVIIASIRSTTGDLAVATFIRIDPETWQAAPVRSGRSERMPIFSFLSRSREATPKALVAPAGTYALAGLDMLQLCLGTIAFTVEAGSTVNLGVISVNEEPATAADPLGPVPTRQVRIDPADSESARVALSRAPELVSRVEQASFFNGVHLECSAAFPSAMGGVAMPGAPYRGANTQAAVED